ncbi:MAG: hypothetical protein HQ553_05430 [Chloroflexi bacterium]|nr:hypothetical protein [Chloroflexota bacterium]
MRKAIVTLALLLIPVFALGMLACSDNNDDDLMRSSQSFTIDDGDLTLEISDLKVDPNAKRSWRIGEKNFNVTASVRNVGTTAGTYSAVLDVGSKHKTKHTEEVFLDSGANETVNFLIVKKDPGIYQLELGELKNEFKIGTKAYTIHTILGLIYAIVLLSWLVRFIIKSRATR